MGVKRRPLGMSKNQIDEAIELREQGTSVQQIATRLGFAYNTLRRELIIRGMR
ncbi:MAG: helix-turn-helix domain-containing protein [Actinomycetota bacterium]